VIGGGLVEPAGAVAGRSGAAGVVVKLSSR
jgi:hypothetical protein